MTILREERIGNQRLILGDCLAIMPTLGRFDAVVTGPPYGIGFSRGSGGGIGGGAYVSKFDGRKIAGDSRPFDPAPVMGRADRLILWGGNHYASSLPPSPSWLVWDKRAASGHTNSFADCELAWTNLGGVARMFRHHWDGMMRASERGIPRVHQTQKPIALMEWCLGFMPDALSILDPYMGSGTTLVACQRMGRQGTGIEIDPEYFDAACRRVEECIRQPPLLAAMTEQEPLL